VTLPGPRSPLAQVRVAAEMHRRAPDALRRLHERYGQVVAFGYGPFRYVALFGPEANRYLLADHPERFRWREALASLITVDGDTALVVSDGEEHQRRRRLVQPAFSTKRIHGYLDLMVNEVDRELDTWVPGRYLDAFESLRRAVRSVAVRSLFGDALGARADELGDALAGAIEFVNLPVSLQFKVDLPWTRWHRAKAARDRADAIVNAEIARRQADPAFEDSGDVLDMLLAATDDEGGPGLSDLEIRDQVVSLVAAGYDTTSAAAAWAIHELLVNDGQWALAADEVGEVVGDGELSPDDFQRMPYLDAVVNETLRLWPPGFVSARKAVDNFEFAGYRIPAGSMVLYSPYVTHRLPELWPEPDTFRPDRWRDPEPIPYSFVPFGGGYRRCIGFAFATQELKALLVQLLRRVELARQPGPVIATGAAALHPKDGIPVRVERLLASTPA
jgi:cytochrome P450